MNKRKIPLISKNKIVIAINLYENKIDDTVNNIKILTNNYYEIEGDNGNYSVDITNNKVSKIYPDPDW